MGLRDGLRDFLSLPRKDRRARSEAGSIVDPSEVDLVVPRPAESSSDLGIGPSILPTPVPSTLQNRESSGMRTALFRTIRLTIAI
jgi:hypothetical protein